MVTQRIANPCTPVRFRYSPPNLFNDLDGTRHADARVSKHSSKHSVFVPFSDRHVCQPRIGTVSAATSRENYPPVRIALTGSARGMAACLVGLRSLRPLVLRLNGSDFLTNLFRIMQNHCRTLSGDRGNEVISAAGLYELTGRVVTPGVNIVVQGPDPLPEARTAADAPRYDQRFVPCSLVSK